MLNLTTLYDNFYNVVHPRLNGKELILQDQKGNEPTESYVTYKIKSWHQIGTSHQSRTDNTWTSTTTVKTQWKVCLNFVTVGTNSEELALLISTLFNKTSFLAELEAVDLSFLYKNDIKYTPKILTTDIESRHLLECYFNVIVTDTDTTGYIQSAEIEGTVKDDVGNTVYHETIIATAP